MYKILVIDDEETIVTYLTLVLEDSGYATISAEGADEGLALARTDKPDLITLDIMMPKRSGLSAFAEIKTDPELAGIPVIIISGFTALYDFRDPEAFGSIVRDVSIPQPEYCMEKPIDIPIFLKVVEQLCRGEQVQVENAL